MVYGGSEIDIPIFTFCGRLTLLVVASTWPGWLQDTAIQEPL